MNGSWNQGCDNAFHRSGPPAVPQSAATRDEVRLPGMRSDYMGLGQGTKDEVCLSTREEVNKLFPCVCPINIHKAMMSSES